MSNIIFLLLALFNCSKLNFKNLENISKISIPGKLVQAIEAADDTKIKDEISKLQNKNINLRELGSKNKNFLMFLLENYGKKIQEMYNEDNIKRKISIFNEYLKEFKENINESDSEGKTILFYAIDTDIPEIVTSVLNIENIDTGHLNNKSISPLNYCILNSNHIFNYLSNPKNHIPNTKLNYLSKFNLSKNRRLAGASPLILSVCSGKAYVVKILLDNGVNVNIENEKDTKAVWLAAHFCSEESVEELLARGAKHLTRDKIFLSKFGHVMGVIFKALIQKSIDASLTVAGNASGVGIGGIPVGLDINSILNLTGKNISDIDKVACYKEVRRIYKKGKWITKIGYIDDYIAIEYGKLLSDIWCFINKMYIKTLKMKDHAIKNKDFILLSKTLSIIKFSHEDLEGDCSTSTHATDKIKNNFQEIINSLPSDTDDYLKHSLEEFCLEIKKDIYESPQILQMIKIDPYVKLNSLKDKKFSDYLKSQGEVPSFYELENLFKEVLEDFKFLISSGDNNRRGYTGYENLMNFLHDHYQRREKIKERFIDFFSKLGDSPRLFKYISKKIEKVSHTQKVSKINNLFQYNNVQKGQEKTLRPIFIKEGKQEYSFKEKVIDKVINNEKSFENDKPELYINYSLEDHYVKNFIKKYKKLIAEKEKIFNFINKNFK